MAMTVAGKNRIVIYGPKEDGTTSSSSRQPQAMLLAPRMPPPVCYWQWTSPATEGGPGRCNCQFCRD